ncbi:hypothetical protein ACQR1V_02655 [Bradyrhizobium oligotrophicum]|uniref:hypothetical protein n=1 Tax=Bradyrhizobium oligotrophicum TaxID=44255 RepID=UPI003EBFD2DC
MDELLSRARSGATVNALAGEGNPKYHGKGIISRVKLLAACNADSPEARELKALLKRNADATISPGRPQYRWSDESIALLTENYAKGMAANKIVPLIKARFGQDFTAAAITTKASRLGLLRDVPVKTPRRRVLAPLTAALRFPLNSLLDRINRAVPRHLARDHRDDVIGEIALAIYEGRLNEIEIERRVGEFVNASYRRDHDRFGPLSLDVPLHESGPATLIDTITKGLWQ